MKKTVLVSIITSILTTVVCLLIACYTCCNSGSCSGDNAACQTECQADSTACAKDGASCANKEGCSKGKACCANKAPACGNGACVCDNEEVCKNGCTCGACTAGKEHVHGEGSGMGNMGMHAMALEHLKDDRKALEEALSEEEKATIAEVRTKMEGLEHDHTNRDQIMEQYKAEFDALMAIANNHSESMDAAMTKAHEFMMQEHGKGDGSGSGKGDGSGMGRGDGSGHMDHGDEQHASMFKVHYLMMKTE